MSIECTVGDSNMNRRVLCVDDEPHVLDGYRRNLRNQFDLDVATGAAEALECLQRGEPYAVIISDMRMPGMDGVALLTEIRQRAPDTVRMMLTGCAELTVAIDAVNAGNVFRFLTKPCPPETLAAALNEGLRQFELVQAEKVLLEQTLRGSIKVLCEVLSLANPMAFGRADRLHRLVRALARVLGVKHAWQVEIAAMLSQLGCIALPPNVLDKAYRGGGLSDAEQKAVAEHPVLGAALISHIPRLEPVAALVREQNRPETEAPIGARILKLAAEFDQLTQQGLSEVDAILRLRERGGQDQELLNALQSALRVDEQFERHVLAPADLQNHMILAEDVRTSDGLLLVLRGQQVTLGMKQRLVNFAESGRLSDRLQVLVRKPR
ncbi:MAG: response regulator [Phycisphaerae bacterium]|nr:response regulator [Phycisphaerae bacterium]